MVERDTPRVGNEVVDMLVKGTGVGARVEIIRGAGGGLVGLGRERWRRSSSSREVGLLSPLLLVVGELEGI